MYLYCAGSIIVAPGLASLGSRNSGLTKGLGRMPKFDFRGFAYALKNLEDDNLFLQIFKNRFFSIILLVIFSCSISAVLSKLDNFKWMGNQYIKPMSSVVLSFVLLPLIVLPGKIKTIAGMNLDLIVQEYLSFYNTNRVNFTDILDIISYAIIQDPKIETMYLICCNIITLSILSLLSSFITCTSTSKYEVRVKQGCIFSCALAIIVLIASVLPLYKQEFASPKFVSDSNNVFFHTILNAELINSGYIQSKDMRLVDYEAHPISQNIDPAVFNKDLHTVEQKEFFDKWFIKGLLTFLGALVSPTMIFIVSTYVFTLSKVYQILFILFLISASAFLTFSKKPSYYQAFYSGFIIVGYMLFIDHDQIKLLLTCAAIAIGCLVYDYRLNKVSIDNFVKSMEQEHKKLLDLSVPLCNENVKDIGNISKIIYRLDDGIGFDQRVLINPLEVEIDIENSIFRIKNLRTNLYLVPLFENSLDTIMSQIFAKGEFEWYAPFEESMLFHGDLVGIDGVDDEDIKESYYRVQKSLTCSNIIITGKSGCGKSTLFKLLMFFNKKYIQNATFVGSKLDENGARLTCKYEEVDLKQIHLIQTYLDQSPMKNCFLPITFKEYFESFGVNEQIANNMIREFELDIPFGLKAEDSIFNIKELICYLTPTLSGGELGRLSFIMSLLIHNSNEVTRKVFYLDEPNAAVDPLNGEKVSKRIDSVSGLNILIAHHLNSFANINFTQYHINDCEIKVTHHSKKVIDYSMRDNAQEER